MANRIEGARRRLSAIKQEIAQGKYRAHVDWDGLWAERLCPQFEKLIEEIDARALEAV
jgi:hypothetical protein